MKKYLILVGIAGSLLFSACGTDDNGMTGTEVPCLADQNLGPIAVEAATLNLISDELQDSTISIFQDEFGDQITFTISDGAGAQEYIKRLPEKSPSFNCIDGSFSASYTPEEFFLKMISDDQLLEIEWKVLIQSEYNSEEGRIEFKDVLTVTGVNRIMGELVFFNSHADGPIGPDQQGGIKVPEVFVHGEKIENAFMDDMEFENSNIIINEDFGVAAFKDRLGKWWRHIDFK